MDLTSSRSESRRDSTRVLRAMTPWQPKNSRALEPKNINYSKLPQASSIKCSRKLPHVVSHQSRQEVTLHTFESMVSKEETCEWDREMERFRDSLTSSRVIEARPGGTVYGLGNAEEEVQSCCDPGRHHEPPHDPGDSTLVANFSPLTAIG